MFPCEKHSRNGAGDGNRTHVFSLEGCCSTPELRPHSPDDLWKVPVTGKAIRPGAVPAPPHRARCFLSPSRHGREIRAVRKTHASETGFLLVIKIIGDFRFIQSARRSSKPRVSPTCRLSRVDKGYARNSNSESPLCPARRQSAHSWRLRHVSSA